MQIITPPVAPSRPEIPPMTEYHGRNISERPPCCPVAHSHEVPRRSPRRMSSVPDRGGMVDRWVGTVGEAITSTSASHLQPSPLRASPPQFLPPPPPPLRENSHPKVAERVRIHRVAEGQNVVGDHGNLTPSEMVDLGGCCNSRTAEHLVRDMREESAAQELRHATQCGYVAGSCSSGMSPNSPYQWKGETVPSQSCITRLPMESSQMGEAEREAPIQPSCGCLPVLRALELEVERQAGRAEAHRATSELTALSLEECRSACERQALVLGRRGSDIVGLALALSYAIPLCRACFILTRLFDSHQASEKKGKPEEATIMSSTSNTRQELAKMKSRIPEFQSRGDSKGSERSRSSKKGDAPTSGGSSGSGRSAEPEKSWLCRKREELGRSWGSKKEELSKSGNNEQVNEEGRKVREAMFVDEGGYGKILSHGSRSGSSEDRSSKGGDSVIGSTSSSSGGEECVATRADVGCGGVDAADLVRILEAEAASLVESLDCKMKMLNMAETRTEEIAEECGDRKEEDGCPNTLRQLGKHISILLKSLSSCGIDLKKANEMAAEASSSENELGLLAPNANPEPYPSSQGHLGRKADLEVAVLMQELMAMREERAVLRQRIHALEGEREELGRMCMLLKLGRGEEAAEAGAGGSILPHIPSTKDLIRLVEESGRCGQSSERHREGGAMVDNICREEWLETRLQELALTLEQVATSADVRLRQSTAVMNDLRRTNGNLAHSLDRCRRRYQQRLKTLETQMKNLVERHASQVRTLRQRISQLEERNEAEVGIGRDVSQTTGRAGEISL
ncbi:hypothetical protein J437_LFUL011237 [Ladona fulva]|uniref:Colorectal mutant cancer protein n=1 Tax=Ladona fulva TaxID=123851 RepID=A0A8K0P3H6_LADFU|nr:hypothetical protein J437_LFUL011237 [Ladona fulva]